ncbi:MAG: TIGR03086 family protein [Propionibacteriaceae bacterium]|jgi:uncharacterized protein (TIGR03086 family)|nr:TIGR03086 family protein [Propionibacteriaceae bacterium]
MAEIDPRPDFLAAVAWAVARAEAVGAEQFAWPTGCAGWTVRDVVKHCADVAGLVGGRFGSPARPPLAADAPDDDVRQAFTAAAAALPGLLADDAVLALEVTGPGGILPAARFLGLFTGEFLVHGWDIAAATGQDAEAPADVAARSLEFERAAVPAEGRNARAFGPVVEVSPDAGPTRQLAAWLGRA